MRVHSFNTYNKESEFSVKLSVDEAGSILEISEGVDYSDFRITKQEDGVLFCIKVHSKDANKQFNPCNFENDKEIEIEDTSIDKRILDEQNVLKNDTKPEEETSSPVLDANKESNYANTEDSMQVIDFNYDGLEPVDNIYVKKNQEKEGQCYSELIKEKEELVIRREEILGPLNRMRDQIREYQKDLPKLLYREAFTNLAMLHRDMAVIVENGAIPESIFDELISVIKAFGFEKIEPKRGDALDLKKHTLNDNNKKGEVVFCCMECGWAKGDETILKAIVDVEEAGNGDE